MNGSSTWMWIKQPVTSHCNANRVAENYSDLRKTPLYFAISNGDTTCTETLLAAGARTDLDPLPCILVAMRAERCAAVAQRVCGLYQQGCAGLTQDAPLCPISRSDLVQLLLSYGAEVNCYFKVINNTLFPTALQYCLRDPVMLRLLLNHGYQAHKYVYQLSSTDWLWFSVLKVFKALTLHPKVFHKITGVSSVPMVKVQKLIEPGLTSITKPIKYTVNPKSSL